MAIDPTGASTAYANAARRLSSLDKSSSTPSGAAQGAAQLGGAEATEKGPASFAEAAKGVADAVAKGEKAASQMIVGEADPHSVIEALAVAELAVETAVTVRDKVVEAYQEILRMPI